jgi:hypothetical protein
VRLNHLFYSQILFHIFLAFSFIYFFEFFGGYCLGVTPLPIPNREVKPQRADGTACAGVWESRSLPNLINPGYLFNRGFFYLIVLMFLELALL